jgi:lysozyme
MTFTDEARGLLEKWERLELTAYVDEGGVWTIGYGHTGHEVIPGLVWTREQADLMLQRDLGQYIDGVRKLLALGIVLNDNQFSALVIFAFNIGLESFAASTALRRVNIRAFGDVPPAMALYKYVHDRRTGKLMLSQNLIKRRAWEIELWKKL